MKYAWYAVTKKAFLIANGVSLHISIHLVNMMKWQSFALTAKTKTAMQHHTMKSTKKPNNALHRNFVTLRFTKFRELGR